MADAEKVGPTKAKIIRRILEVAVLLLAIYFIGRYLYQSWPTVRGSLRHLNWLDLLWAWLFFLAYFTARAVAWQEIIISLKHRLPFKDSAYIWFLSEFSRFIPGNVWSFVGRVHLAGQKGVSRTAALISLVIEIIFLLGGTVIFLGAFVWLWPFAYAVDFRWLFVLAVPVLILLLTPSLLEKVIAFLLKKLKQPAIETAFSRGQLLKILLLFTFGWAAYGVGSLFAMKAVVALGTMSWWWLVSGFIVAWLVGYLSFVTPMGLGVREGIIVAMLAPFIGAGLASLVAIITRIWLIISELSVLAAIGLLALFNGRFKRGTS